MIKAENIFRIEGDFIPFLALADFLNYYDRDHKLKNIYPLEAFYLNHRFVGYVDETKYKLCARQTFSDLVSGKYSFSHLQKGYGDAKQKIEKIYQDYFASSSSSKQSASELLRLYKTVYHEFADELVAYTLFIEQLDDQMLSEIVVEQKLNFAKIWQAANIVTFLSFESRNKRLILQTLQGKWTAQFLIYVFLNYTFVPDVQYIEQQLGLYKITELKKELRTADVAVKKAEAKFKRLSATLTPKELKVVKIIKWTMFVRDERRDYLNMSEALLYHIAHRLFKFWRLDIDLLNYVSMCEIPLGHAYLKKQWLQIRKRPNGFGLSMNTDRFFKFTYQNIAGRIKEFDQIILKTSNTHNNQEIRGNIGNQGKAIGKVRIVLRRNDFDSFKTGEILVTSMTRPEFVPLMKKAKAIITDEGGITSHATIISRELNKPCIIGTKNATKILHNGDEVEADADHGVVKIIKRVKV
jgi:phosphohistidine swiveling domain-containing protein